MPTVGTSLQRHANLTSPIDNSLAQRLNHLKPAPQSLISKPAIQTSEGDHLSGGCFKLGLLRCKDFFGPTALAAWLQSMFACSGRAAQELGHRRRDLQVEAKEMMRMSSGRPCAAKGKSHRRVGSFVLSMVCCALRLCGALFHGSGRRLGLFLKGSPQAWL